jgi:hypothetical protein
MGAPPPRRAHPPQLGHLKVRVVTEPPPGLLQHPGALVEAGHDGAPVPLAGLGSAGEAGREFGYPVGPVLLSHPAGVF